MIRMLRRRGEAVIVMVKGKDDSDGDAHTPGVRQLRPVLHSSRTRPPRQPTSTPPAVHHVYLTDSGCKT